jgi:hypothetical protein
MHEEKHKSPETPTNKSIVLEGKQRRLYSWLILCNDSMNPAYFHSEFFVNLLQILSYLYKSMPGIPRVEKI